MNIRPHIVGTSDDKHRIILVLIISLVSLALFVSFVSFLFHDGPIRGADGVNKLTIAYSIARTSDSDYIKISLASFWF